MYAPNCTHFGGAKLLRKSSSSSSSSSSSMARMGLEALEEPAAQARSVRSDGVGFASVTAVACWSKKAGTPGKKRQIQY
eukprot:1086386-Pelagomonas_calceolata.AAC.1